MVEWSLTHHARRRIEEMDLAAAEVARVLDEPTTTYPGHPCYGAGRVVAVAGRLAVVHSPGTHEVITVLWNGKDGRPCAPNFVGVEKAR
jgi:hypothetical protein